VKNKPTQGVSEIIHELESGTGNMGKSTLLRIYINPRVCKNEGLNGFYKPGDSALILLKEHPNSSLRALMTLLHELGHRHHKHNFHNENGFESKREQEAWLYAMSCIKRNKLRGALMKSHQEGRTRMPVLSVLNRYGITVLTDGSIKAEADHEIIRME